MEHLGRDYKYERWLRKYNNAMSECSKIMMDNKIRNVCDIKTNESYIFVFNTIRNDIRFDKLTDNDINMCIEDAASSTDVKHDYN